MKRIPPHSPLLYSKTKVYRVYLFFLFLIPNIDCGYSLERVPTINVLSKDIKKNQNVSTENFYSLQLRKILHVHGIILVIIMKTCPCNIQRFLKV